MLSWHGREEVKEFYVARMAAHIAADDIRWGIYWEKGKGCSVGCTIHSGDHAAYEREDGPGLPEWLAHLQDFFHENLAHADARAFAAALLPAIPVGVDLTPVKWRFLAFLMRENIACVEALEEVSTELKQQVLDAIRGVLILLERAIATGVWDERAAARAAARAVSAERAAVSAAWAVSAESAAASTASAAGWAASAAARAAVNAERAAVSAERAAVSTARAAVSAARAVSAEMAVSAERAALKRFAETFLQLLHEA